MDGLANPSTGRLSPRKQRYITLPGRAGHPRIAPRQRGVYGCHPRTHVGRFSCDTTETVAPLRRLRARKHSGLASFVWQCLLFVPSRTDRIRPPIGTCSRSCAPTSTLLCVIDPAHLRLGGCDLRCERRGLRSRCVRTKEAIDAFRLVRTRCWTIDVSDALSCHVLARTPRRSTCA